LKILFVSAYFAYPQVAHGGGTDLFHLIEALASRHEIHLISFADDWEVAYAAEMRPYCGSLHLIVPANRWRDKLRSTVRTLQTQPFRAPLLLGRRSHREMRRLIAEVTNAQQIDLIQFEWTEAAQFRSAVPKGVCTVLDEVDVSCRPRLQAAMLCQHQLQRALAMRRYKRARAVELALCRTFDAILTRSEADQSFLSALLLGHPVFVFRPWTRVAEFAGIAEEESERDVLLFVGAMDRRPNEDAVLYFHQEIWPMVRRAVPSARFNVVGADPTARVRSLTRDPAITVTGYVPDLRPYYAQCAVFVAPLRVGGGVINKIIDAMAAGRPTVTTPAGNAGIGAAPNKEILIAEQPEEFAQKVIALLRDDILWRRVAAGGRAYVQHVFDWPAAVAKLEEIHRGMVARKNRQCQGCAHSASGGLLV